MKSIKKTILIAGIISLSNTFAAHERNQSYIDMKEASDKMFLETFGIPSEPIRESGSNDRPIKVNQHKRNKSPHASHKNKKSSYNMTNNLDRSEKKTINHHNDNISIKLDPKLEKRGRPNHYRESSKRHGIRKSNKATHGINQEMNKKIQLNPTKKQ